MATKKQTYDVKDFTEPVKEFSRLLKETYLSTLDFSLSVAEENSKVFGKQLDYVIDAEKEYVGSVKDFYGAFQKDDTPFGKIDTKAFDEGVDSVLEFQKNVAGSLKGMSESAAAETHEFAKQNVLKAFSIFDEALDAIKI